MNFVIEQLPVRNDNYAVLVHDPASGVTASIDAPEAGAIRTRLAENDWNLTDIFVTHHHADHVEGIPPLKDAYDLTVTAPAGEADKIPGVDRTVGEQDTFAFAGHLVSILETPGHTLGHVTYWIPAQKVAFAGDTLFAMGCGRVFEGTAEMMWRSLEKLMALPDETVVYCGHEYTEANARFAATVDPDNPHLAARTAEVAEKRSRGEPTLPTTIDLEKRTNPFLRVDDPAIRAHLGMETATAAEVFAEIRRRKDDF